MSAVDEILSIQPTIKMTKGGGGVEVKMILFSKSDDEVLYKGEGGVIQKMTKGDWGKGGTKDDFI